MIWKLMAQAIFPKECIPSMQRANGGSGITWGWEADVPKRFRSVARSIPVVPKKPRRQSGS
jgi:hypothetical protein